MRESTRQFKGTTSAKARPGIAYGPVPSRRLGRSLGINNVHPKVCTYSCAYCQVGHTLKMQIERREFYEPEEIVREVREKAEKALRLKESIDYVTVVPDGEPTLDINLGREIHLLQDLGIKIGVITNASLLWKEDVREELANADWVSVKIDAAREEIWRKLNRPHPSLRLSSVMDGIRRFAKSFRGELVTETMLVKGVSDGAAHLHALSDVLSQVNPQCCYVSIPTRPPAEDWVRPPTAEVLAESYSILAGKLDNVQYLMDYESDWFTCTGSVEQDLMGITAVHPMRETAVEKFLEIAGADWSVVQQLIHKGLMVACEFDGKRFYRSAPWAGDQPGQSVGGKER